MVDPVCIVTEDGWCNRHQVNHTGRLLELALAPTDQGARYRKLWDQQLRGRLLQQAAQIATGPETAPAIAPEAPTAAAAAPQRPAGGCGCGKRIRSH
jgi:hypothetical protein